MATTSINTAVEHCDTLTALRTYRAPQQGVRDDKFDIAKRQAHFLSSLLAASTEQIPMRLLEVIDGLHLVYANDIPWHSTSFRRADRWFIHVRASDSADVQTFSMLRELKYIIDRDARGDNSRGGVAATLADYFASQVIAQAGQASRK